MAVIRDAIDLLGSQRPDLTVEQLIAVIAREYRHSATGETAGYLAQQAESMFPDPTDDADTLFTEALEIAAGLRGGDLDDAIADYRAALTGLDDDQIAVAMEALDDAIKDDSGQKDSEIWDGDGKLPTPKGGETQDAANARICRNLRRLREPLPDAGTPLGDWLREPGRIWSVGSRR
jgi:hypothetical protein